MQSRSHLFLPSQEKDFRLACPARGEGLERMNKLAGGGAAANAEVGRMIGEKAAALVEAHLAAAAAMMAGNPLLASHRALAVYHRRVKANQRRLGGPST